MPRTLEGQVIAQHGRLSRVQAAGEVLVVPSRRNLRWQGQPPEPPHVVVGDRVTVELDREDGQIVAAGERRNVLQRRSPRTGRSQVLAANVDQALIMLAARQPDPKPGLLDRFLVACHLGDIEPLVVINKIDLGVELVRPWLGVYTSLGYTLLLVSALQRSGIDGLQPLLSGRTTLFCGASGVGKSSLLNAIHPGLRLKVGSISEASGKGRHTTSRAELLALPAGGFVIDTPGLKEFGLWDAGGAEIAAAFPEIVAHGLGCRFQNCSHTHEPDCAVAAAVDAGEMAASRYSSYVSMLDDAGGA